MLGTLAGLSLLAWFPNGSAESHYDRPLRPAAFICRLLFGRRLFRPAASNFSTSYKSGSKGTKPLILLFNTDICDQPSLMQVIKGLVVDTRDPSLKPSCFTFLAKVYFKNKRNV